METNSISHKLFKFAERHLKLFISNFKANKISKNKLIEAILQIKQYKQD